MTKSQDYFNTNILEKIINKKGEKFFFEKIFSLKRVNLHSFKSYNEEEIFKLWPKSFVKFFLDKLDASSVKKLYYQLDYPIEKFK